MEQREENGGRRLRDVITFAGTTDALRAEQLAAERGFSGRLIPLPAQIDADCGLAFLCAEGEREQMLAALKGQVEPQGVWQVLLRC